MKYSKGIMWLDDCRIPFVDEVDVWKGRIGGFQDVYVGGTCKKHNEDNTKGRFTPNLLVCDDMLNDGSVSKTNDGKRHNKTTQMFYGKGEHYYTGDKGTNSRYYDLDKWFDKIIDNL
jgi:hypothetical protein